MPYVIMTLDDEKKPAFVSGIYDRAKYAYLESALENARLYTDRAEADADAKSLASAATYMNGLIAFSHECRAKGEMERVVVGFPADTPFECEIFDVCEVKLSLV